MRPQYTRTYKKMRPFCFVLSPSFHRMLSSSILQRKQKGEGLKRYFTYYTRPRLFFNFSTSEGRGRGGRPCTLHPRRLTDWNA